MKTDTTYAQKFAELAPWYDQIFTSVKKDLRDEHLKADKNFFKRNFPGKMINKLEVQDLISVYAKFIERGFEELSEFIANRWLLRHLDIYNFFEQELKKTNVHFEQIDELEEATARSLMQEAIEKFGAVDSYIFSIINMVAFPPSVLNELKSHAAKPSSTP